MRLDPQEEFRQLCLCVRAGDAAKAGQIYQGTDVNQAMNSWDSRTPLTFAVLSSNVGMVKFLLNECKADPAICDDKRRNAIHHAVLEGNEEIVSMIIAHGGVDFRMGDQWEQTPLHLAALGNNVNVARMVLDQFPECLDAHQADGRTPIEVATMNNDQFMASFLMQAANTLAAKQIQVSRPESKPSTSVTEPRQKDGEQERPSSRSSNDSEGHDQVFCRQAPCSTALPKDVSMARDRPAVKEIVKNMELRRSKSNDVHQTRASMEESACRNNMVLRNVLDKFHKANEQTRTEFETRLCSLDVSCSRDIVNQVRQNFTPLYVGCDLGDEEVDQRLQQMFDFWGLESIQNEITALQHNYPESDSLPALSKTIAELIASIRGSKYPTDVLELTQLENAVDSLRHLCEFELQNPITEMMKRTEELNSNCVKLEARLELLKETQDFDAIRQAEEETEHTFRSAINASKGMLESCADKCEDMELRERLDQIKNSSRHFLAQTNGNLRENWDRVRHNVCVIERNGDGAVDMISKTLSDLTAKGHEFNQQISQDETLRRQIAEQIDQLLQADIDRQRSFDIMLIEKKQNDIACKEVKAVLTELQASKQAKLEKFGKLSKVYENSMKAVEGFHSIVNAALDTSHALWVKRQNRIEA